MKSHRSRCVVAAALIASAACFNPIGPANRKDPGTRIAEVRNETGTPVPGVCVYVELPNSVGGFFTEGSPTRSDGTVRFQYVPSGRRPVEVKPPAGYSVVGRPKRDVDVINGKTVTIRFTVRRT